MPIQRTHRVPILLLGLLGATLLFPGAFDEARVAVGSWLPATVRPSAAPEPLQAEETARLKGRIAALESVLALRPGGDGPLGNLRILPRTVRDAPSAIEARVIHRTIAAQQREFMIDAGTDDGVRPGMPVLQMDSLVGIVKTSAAGASRVVRIDDRAAVTSFPAAILDSAATPGSPLRAQGAARGMGDGRIRVSFLPQGAARAGDLVVTAAGTRLVPEGLVLGMVVSSDDEDRDGEFEAVVRPLRDLDAIGSVLVLQIESPGLRVEAK